MNNKKIAVFFDCENISSKYVDEIFAELVNHAEVIIKQAYKDFSTTQYKSRIKNFSKSLVLNLFKYFQILLEKIQMI